MSPCQWLQEGERFVIERTTNEIHVLDRDQRPLCHAGLGMNSDMALSNQQYDNDSRMSVATTVFFLCAAWAPAAE